MVTRPVPHPRNGAAHVRGPPRGMAGICPSPLWPLTVVINDEAHMLVREYTGSDK